MTDQQWGIIATRSHLSAAGFNIRWAKRDGSVVRFDNEADARRQAAKWQSGTTSPHVTYRAGRFEDGLSKENWRPRQ